MEIEYNITRYFEDNNLFNNSNSDGLDIKLDNNVLTIKGNTRDLVELADLIVNVAKDNNHIHVDDLTLIKKDSNIKEIIIEKE